MALKSIEPRFVVGNDVLAQQKVVQANRCGQEEVIVIDLARRLDLPESRQSMKNIGKFRPKPWDLTFKELKNKIGAHPSNE